MNYAVIDFETTGNQPDDEIIQIGLVRIEDGRITDRFASFVKPRRAELPEFIRRLTGIDEAMLADAPVLEDAMPRLLPYLHDAVLVAHHAAFDLMFLQRGLDQCGYSPFDGPVLDTLDFLRIAYPGLATLQLSMVTQSFELEHDRPHRADSDAEATALIWLQILEKLEQLPLMTIQRLCDLFNRVQPLFPDMAWFFRELLHDKQLKTALDYDRHKYFREFALRVDDWTEEAPPRGEGEAERLDADFDAFYDELKRRMAERFPGYEHRPAQERMIREIMDAFESGKHLLIEAGTGTGKSLGYLIPALYYGIKHEAKITVSTHTINLQEQIRKRDIPLLQELFPVPFQAAVLKGRSHYLCLRKFEHRVNQADSEMTRDEVMTAAQLIVWLTETEHGEDEEIHFDNKGLEFWHSVASDADSCLNRACPWFRKCFYHRAKNRANLADVVITNHSLLFTDLKAEHRLIPTYRHLIVDEAHHLEETAGKHLGESVTYLSVANVMQILYRDHRFGQLPALCRQLGTSGDERLMDAAARLQNGFARLVEAREAWDALHDFLYQTYLARLESGQDGGQPMLRIKPDRRPHRWETAEELAGKFTAETAQWVKETERVLNEVKESDAAEDIQGLVTDVGGLVKELQRLADTVCRFMAMGEPDYVYWIEGSHFYKSKSIQLHCVPIDVSEQLKEAFFDKKDSVVLTSATLSVNRSFDYTAEQLGLTESKQQGRLCVVQLPSTFNYRENVLVCIPRDFPRIKGAVGEAEFTERLVDSLGEVAASTRGRMLVLFTSYRMLKVVHGMLKARLAPLGIEVLGQGIDSGNRSKLTRWFRDSAAAVLLGTSSFWEGVDIPGEALSCLAIVRLPFQPPNHPLVEAKSEYMRKQNRNPFMDYSVPQAVIRFKQGFGRLVRTSGDYGIVIVYDTRVLDTQYGKHFLYSLPGPKMEHLPTSLLVGRVREWLERKGDDIHDQVEP
jgi:ATP-dependent DNA helicase DinG